MLAVYVCAYVTKYQTGWEVHTCSRTLLEYVTHLYL